MYSFSQEIPAPVLEAKEQQQEQVNVKETKSQIEGKSEELKIAWRYQHLPKVQVFKLFAA